MSALDFIRNIDGGHFRLGAQEFDDFVGYEGFVCRGIRGAMNSNTFMGSCEFFDQKPPPMGFARSLQVDFSSLHLTI